MEYLEIGVPSKILNVRSTTLIVLHDARVMPFHVLLVAFDVNSNFILFFLS